MQNEEAAVRPGLGVYIVEPIVCNGSTSMKLRTDRAVVPETHSDVLWHLVERHGLFQPDRQIHSLVVQIKDDEVIYEHVVYWCHVAPDMP